jgi:hypothetical protein
VVVGSRFSRRLDGKRRVGVLATVIVALFVAGTHATQAASPSFGLEWPGDGAVRRMLFWHNPFPIYDATDIFKVFPRKKIVPTNSPTGCYTTSFWGNAGAFVWDGGNANSYYGAHPYPIPAPSGPGQWELSVYSNDYVTGSEVQWGALVYPDHPRLARTVDDPPRVLLGLAGYDEGDHAYHRRSELDRSQSADPGDRDGAGAGLETGRRGADIRDGKNSTASSAGSRCTLACFHFPTWAGTTAKEWSDAADTIPPAAPSNVMLR